MKQIYFVLTRTGTIVSKIVQCFMKDEYSHVSLSLDKELNYMYSFGRLNPYNTFYGGFIHEYTDKGTFKRFYKTKARIIEFNITDNQYESLKSQISEFEKKKRKYKFNTKGLFAVYINKRVERENYFYCAEFVKHILENANIELNLPKIIRPEHFKEIKDGKIIYEGLLREYKKR